MNLRDEHLQQALQHAPDCDLAPDSATRKAVLDYAAKSLYQPKISWLQRCQLVLTLDYWHIARWQLAGMGSAITVLLVVVVFWGQRTVEPGSEPIQVASAPTDRFQRKADVLTKGKLAESGTDAKPKILAQSAPQADVPSSVVVATAESLDDAEYQDKTAVNTRIAGLAAKTAEAEALSSAPSLRSTNIASNEAHSDVVSKLESDKLELAKKIKPAGDIRTEVQSQPGMPSVVGATISAGNNNVLALALAKEGGKTIANKDIQSGKLRILSLDKPFSVNKSLVDEATHYPIQVLVSDNVTEVLIAELEAYNQTMRNWHAGSGN